MDVNKALRELYEEKRRLDAAIATLEARLRERTSRAEGRRGRRSMGREERLEVSKRMLKYWQMRRAQLQPPEEPTKIPPAVNRSE